MSKNERCGRIKPSAVLLLVLVAFAGTSKAKYSGGTGEPKDPYRIATPNDLNDIGNHVEDYNKCFVMINDIDLADYSYTRALIAADTNSVDDGFQGTPFTGTFDGKDCSVHNLTINTAGAGNDYLGLFGQIGEFGRVKNLGIEDVNVTSGDRSKSLGGLCGENEGTISGCFSIGTVSGDDWCGGLVGQNTVGTISSCWSSSAVSGTVVWSVSHGGLVGRNYGIITTCRSTGQVSGDARLGGLVGENHGSITNSSSAGEVSGGYSDGSYYWHERLGGLVGSNFGTISNCYSTGSVQGTVPYADTLGGLVGYNQYGTIANCYSTASVSYYKVLGGLVGENYQGTITSCYSVGRVSGNWYVGAFVGDDYGASVQYKSCFWDVSANPGMDGIGSGRSEPNLIGKTTAEMMTKSTFVDSAWDLVGEVVNGPNDIWTIHETVDYPKHVWPLVNFVGWYEVDGLDFAYFAERWGDTSCADSNDCDGRDLDFSGGIDWGDLKILCDHWLEGAE